MVNKKIEAKTTNPRECPDCGSLRNKAGWTRKRIGVLGQLYICKNPYCLRYDKPTMLVKSSAQPAEKYSRIEA